MHTSPKIERDARAIESAADRPLDLAAYHALATELRAYLRGRLALWLIRSVARTINRPLAN